MLDKLAARPWRTRRGRAPMPLETLVTSFKFITDGILLHGCDADMFHVLAMADCADALKDMSTNNRAYPDIWGNKDFLTIMVQLHGFAVRHAATPSSRFSSALPAPEGSLQRSCRLLVDAVESCLPNVDDISCRRRVALAMLRSGALQGFSVLIASDARQLQLAAEKAQAEDASQLMEKTQMQQEHERQGGPFFVRGFDGQPPAGSAVPSRTCHPSTQQLMLRLYHSLEQAGCLFAWLVGTLMAANGVIDSCGCNVCIKASAKATASSTAPGLERRERESSQRPDGAISTDSSSSSCLLLALWRALHESWLVEQLVGGVLLLFGQQEEGAGTRRGGSSSTASGSTSSSAGVADGVTEGGSLVLLGGQGSAALGARPPGRRSLSAAPTSSRVTTTQMVAAEVRNHVTYIGLQLGARNEYYMQPGQESLQLALSWLTGGMTYPAPEHPAWPHVVACLSRPGCRLAAAAAMVAAVCAEDGGPTYGLELGPLLAAAGGVPLVATEKALAEAMPGGVERSWVKVVRSTGVMQLTRRLHAWAKDLSQPHAVDARTLDFTVSLCRRVVTLCLERAGTAARATGGGWAGEQGEQRRGGNAERSGGGGGGPDAPPVERFSMLQDATTAEVAGLALQAFDTMSWAIVARNTGKRLEELRGLAGAGPRPGAVRAGREEREEELQAMARKDGQWLPVWWWRQVFTALPLLVGPEEATPGELACRLVKLPTLLQTGFRRSPVHGIYPATPHAGLSHPLSAGLLPTLEHLLAPDSCKALATQARLPELEVAGTLAQSLLQSRPEWGWLLAYADPQEAASFMRTCAQLLMHQVEQLNKQRSYGEVPEALRQVVEAMSYLLIGACTPLVQATGAYAADVPPSPAFARSKCGPWAVRCTGPRCPHCSSGAPWRGERACGSGSGRAAGGDGDMDGGGSGGGGAAVGPCPGRRLATNVSSALLHLLPVLTHAVYRAAERGRTRWAADATSDFISALVPACVRALADAERGKADPTSGAAKQQQQQQQQTANKQQLQGRQGQGAAMGPSTTGAGTEAVPGAEAISSPDGGLSCASAPGPRSWRDVLLALDPIRLLKLQLRSGREPRCADCVYVVRMLALAVGPELGAAVGSDGELCELLVARAAGAGASDRKEWQEVLLILEPSRAVEALYGRMGLPPLSRVALRRARAGLDHKALAPLLVEVADVEGMGRAAV